MIIDKKQRLTITLEGEEVDNFKKFVSEAIKDAKKTGFITWVPDECRELIEKLNKEIHL